MEILKDKRKLIILTILILVILYIILNIDEESTNKEVPKRATFVNNHVEAYIYHA
ncbi:MAG: hypothetical protein ACOXZT_03825 [Tissierellaceae bacterium]|nr:hypothetical protein [Tissierellia bacterium]